MDGIQSLFSWTGQTISLLVSLPLKARFWFDIFSVPLPSQEQSSPKASTESVSVLFPSLLLAPLFNHVFAANIGVHFSKIYGKDFKAQWRIPAQPNMVLSTVGGFLCWLCLSYKMQESAGWIFNIRHCCVHL